MARLNVNPTRMEMTRLKGQLKTATRGHKLLKDKLDELMKQFMEIVRENKRLREEAETALENAYKNFIIARAVLSEASLGEALMIPQQSVSVKVTKKNIMSVNVPVFDFQKEGGGDGNIAHGGHHVAGGIGPIGEVAHYIVQSLLGNGDISLGLGSGITADGGGAGSGAGAAGGEAQDQGQQQGQNADVFHVR